MSMFDFLKKTSKGKVKGKGGKVSYKNRGQYTIIDTHSHTIAPSSQDNRTEDEVLDHSKRARLLDVTRNLVRNSSVMNTLLGQITTRTVSVNGGKVILNFQDEPLNKNLKRYFMDFTRNAGFYDGQSFNLLLKRVLRETIIAGDCVLVFDDGLVEGSGKILMFESEEIVGVDEAVIQRQYGAGAYQSQGKVYSKNGRWIGTVVSRSERGSEKADPKKCWFLHRDPNGNPLESNWFQPQTGWRDGRAVSQAASIVGTIHQLSDLVESELMAARRNSQIFAFLQQSASQEEDIPSAFDPESDFEQMTDEEIENTAKQEASTTQTIDMTRAREASVEFCSLPEGVTANQLDTSHPNDSVKTMVEWLSTNCASVLGISKVFINGDPTNGDFRANQLYTYAAIEEFQKFLEGVCDWAFYQTMKFKGINFEIDDMKDVSWEWRGIDDLDPLTSANAQEKKLRNLTITYREILGNNWKEKLQQSAEEIKWLKDNGLPLAAYNLISGGQGVGADEVSEIEE